MLRVHMQYRRSLACITLLLTAVPGVLAATSVVKLKNDKVSVTEDRLNPGEASSLPDKLPSVIVYLSGGIASVGPLHGKISSQPVKRGETIFVPATAATIKNAGPSALRFVRIAFLGDGSMETWGRTGLAPNYKLLFENRYTRVYDIRIPAETKEPRHTHHARIVVCLSGAILEHILPNGQRQPSTLKTGEIAWRPGQTHVGHNLGKTNLWVIAIEPK